MLQYLPEQLQIVIARGFSQVPLSMDAADFRGGVGVEGHQDVP